MFNKPLVKFAAVLLVFAIALVEFLPMAFNHPSRQDYTIASGQIPDAIINSVINAPTNTTSDTLLPTINPTHFISDLPIPTNLTHLTSGLTANHSGLPATLNDALSSSDSSYVPPTGSTYLPETDQPFINGVIPPANTALFLAYQQGGTMWYQEKDNVLVIFEGNTIRSFKASTGEETNWLQDRLSYDPINSDNALQNYTTNYRGQIVAETNSWALVKFPSGGFLKIAKPTSSKTKSTFLTQQ